jgi:hypothetical protein
MWEAINLICFFSVRWWSNRLNKERKWSERADPAKTASPASRVLSDTGAFPFFRTEILSTRFWQRQWIAILLYSEAVNFPFKPYPIREYRFNWVAFHAAPWKMLAKSEIKGLDRRMHQYIMHRSFDPAGRSSPGQTGTSPRWSSWASLRCLHRRIAA